MKTILAAKESVSQLWGYPKPKDTKYRLMKYLLRVEVENGILLHNTVTRHMILLSNEEAEKLSELPLKPTERMQELIANHFLVPEDFDEYKSVKQLRRIYQNKTSGGAINHFIILPTTFCNAHCFYCYESDYPHVQMTEETAHKLVEYIDRERKGKDVLISWFGGEPLVGIARIDQISHELTERGITFSSSMISNGYLFDEKITERAVELWKLKRIQITLDGTEEVYNRVKAYVNVKDNPYQRVLKNIELISGKGIHVNIRLNVDFYNKDDIKELIEELGKRFAGNKNVTAYLNVLFNDQGFDPVHHTEAQMVDLMRIIDEYTRRLIELGMAYSNRSIPMLKSSQCMADSPHAIEIQPDGSFCRCEHECIRDSYGNIEQGILDAQKPLKWKENIERSEFCPDCNLYPECYLLRYCMNAETPCIDAFRDREQDRCKDVLISAYKKYLEEEKDERVQGS